MLLRAFVESSILTLDTNPIRLFPDEPLSGIGSQNSFNELWGRYISVNSNVMKHKYGRHIRDAVRALYAYFSVTSRAGLWFNDPLTISVYDGGCRTKLA